MLKRQGTHRTDEIAIVDVAMATLGPVALLMMVFMLLAAKTMASSVACQNPTAEEVTTTAEALKTWMGEYAHQTGERKNSLQATCSTIAPVEPQYARADLSPSPLEGYCAAKHNDIIAMAGLSRAEVERVLKARAGVDDAMAQCFGKPLPVQCEKRDPRQSKAMVTDLNALRAQVRQQTDRLASAARDLCGKRPTLRLEGPKPAIIPESLRQLCPSEIEQVMREADASVEQVGRELAARDAAAAALMACWTKAPGLGNCRQIASEAKGEEVARLSRWAERVRSGNAERIARIQKDCPQPIPSPEPAGLPGFLKDMCPGDLATILEQAMLTGSEVMLIEGASRQTLEIAEQCSSPQTENISPRIVRLEFESCSERLANITNPTPLFEKEASEIASRVREGRYNRIDIFGHTDRHMIVRQCGNGAKNNIELSSNRAHYYREWLNWAFRNDQQYRDIVERLDRNDLKIYAIGVGEAELIDRAETATADALNRRIEIRFVADRIGTPAP